MMEACHLALAKAGLSPDDIDYFIAGDLLNQVISASFCARRLACLFWDLWCLFYSDGRLIHRRNASSGRFCQEYSRGHFQS